MDCTKIHTLLVALSLVSSVLPATSDNCRPRNSRHFFLVPSQAPSTTRTKTTPSNLTAKMTETTPSTQPSPAAVKSICTNTTYPSLCESSVQPYLPTTTLQSTISDTLTATTTSSVVVLLLKASKNHTLTAMASFEQKAKDPKTPKALAANLDDCRSTYEDGLDNYDTATEAVEKGDIATAEIDVSAVIDDFEECGDVDSPTDPTLPGEQPWTKYGDLLAKLADDILDLCNVLK